MSEWTEARDVYLRGLVSPHEEVLAAGPMALVTQERILFTWRVYWAGSTRLRHDQLRFDEIVSWSEGSRHDGRPLLRLQHPEHRRLQWAPQHRVLSFRWGDTVAWVPRTDTTLSFRGPRDPVLRVLRARLETEHVPEGEPFVVTLEGSRQERLKGGQAGLRSHPIGALNGLRFRLRQLNKRLHHGQIHWWIRLGSWALLAVPAWFVNPWLVMPAILAVEAAWIVGLQWSWRKEERRRVGGAMSYDPV
jgi:hypothetical protein